MGEYTITISPDGSTIKTDAQGFTDDKCLEGMDDVFKKLGGSPDVERKPEAHVKNPNTVTQR